MICNRNGLSGVVFFGKLMPEPMGRVQRLDQWGYQPKIGGDITNN